MYKILLIEDSIETHALLAQILGGISVEWVIAANAEEARNIFATSFDFDLIILDMKLPDRSGIEVLIEIRRLPKFNNTPILLYTAVEEMVSKIAAFDLGIDDYIVKAMNPIEVRLRIESRLRKTKDREQIANKQFGDLLLDMSLSGART